MDLALYNSLSKEKEQFKSHTEGVVTLYSCGPTVYNYPHIGNYRAYISADILKRYLTYCGYAVNHVMNITDVDDKTIRDSQSNGKSLREFTEFYTEEFFKDRDMLNIQKPTLYTKATEYIDAMIAMIEELMQKGYAYKGEDGSVYFDIRKDATYGKLSHINLSALKENADGRLKKDEYDKENAEDFALWKAWDTTDGEVFWDTALGKGRPGWHIECSAMSIATLGTQIDIHTGGIDLLFPHHENEIAQSECATGEQFVSYWIHNEHLMVEGKKMSKSLGNFYTLRDLIEKGIDPLAFRYWLYTGHYRTKVNFTIEAVEGSQNALRKLYEIYGRLGDELGATHKEYVTKFKSSMNDDLNTPQAIALMWELIKDTDVSPSCKKATLREFDSIFGFGLENYKAEEIPTEVTVLVEEREGARNSKNWTKSDELRDTIRALGYEVKDTDTGPSVIRSK